MTCQYFKEQRVKYIHRIYYTNPNMTTFQDLLNSQTYRHLLKLSFFTEIKYMYLTAVAYKTIICDSIDIVNVHRCIVQVMISYLWIKA